MKKEESERFQYCVQIEFEGEWEGLNGENSKALFSEPPTNDVMIYTRSKDDAERIAENIGDTSIGHMVENTSTSPVDELEDYMRVPESGGKINTFPYSKTRNHFQTKVEEKLSEEVINSEEYDKITALNQVKDAFEDIHPILSEYNLLYESKKKVKNHIKQNDVEMLSKRSRSMIGDKSRHKSGQDSEQTFRSICDEDGLNLLKTQQGFRSNEVANPDFKDEFPDIFEEMIKEFGIEEEKHHQGLYSIVTGLPDFIVWGESTELDWIPQEKPFFVEVKAEKSSLTDRQKKTFPKIKQKGYSILIFRDKGEEYELREYK